MNGTLPAFLPPDFNFSGNIRRYYLAAEEIEWDYAPSGWDNSLGVPFNMSPRAYQAGYTTSSSLGQKWTKAVYKGYTDSSFTTLTEQPSWMGLNGPIMRAEVGDMIEIFFVNKMTSNYGALHSMGLGYNKANEGSVYPTVLTSMENTVGAGDAVPPGGCFTYKWIVPASSAPLSGSNAALRAYHNYVNLEADLNAGLQGPFIVYASGQMNATMAANREFVFLLDIFDETKSFLASTNAAKAGIATNTSSIISDLMSMQMGNYTTWYPQVANMPSTSLTSAQAPAWHTINGYVFNNVRFDMCSTDAVIWYVYAFGSASHVFHLHGNNFRLEGQGTWQASHALNDGNMAALTMNAGAPGLWNAICHVSNHFEKGMVAEYNVQEAGSCTLPSLASS